MASRLQTRAIDRILMKAFPFLERISRLLVLFFCVPD